MTENIPVVAENDFIARQIKADPISALAELIWNSLDAEASDVHISFEYKNLASGLSKVVVTDNGNGFSYEEAKAQFGRLGGSWKRLRRETEIKKRMIHGKEGRGRYRAFAIGKDITWTVNYQDQGGNKSYSIRLLANNLKSVQITDVQRTKNTRGVTVEIEDIEKDYRVFSTDEGTQRLTEIFAIYLTHYSDAQIWVAAERLDPQKAIVDRKSYELSSLINDGREGYVFSLEIIEWKTATTGGLYLCSENGFPLSQTASKFSLNGYPFSAYLKSSYITELANKELLGLPEMDMLLLKALESARIKIKEHFRNRVAVETKTVVDQWKEQKIYPYSGDPHSSVESAERQVFDILAVNMRNFTPEFDNADSKTKALNFRMLRNAIENDPGDLRKILSEVLDLPKQKQKELAELLQETSLSSIIAAAKTVADRLKFISALEEILFNKTKKERLKERAQLHKILEQNTWIFGEQYNLWVSDQSLTKVLKEHKKHLDQSVVIDDSVQIDGKKRGIVDLMFSTQNRRHIAGDIENLVIELKAPKVKIGHKEIAQIEGYATAVAEDERFHTLPNVRWHFWLISNQLEKIADNRIEGGPNKKDKLILQTAKIQIGLKTWAELIDENRARLQFFQEKLQHNATEVEALKYLQEKHKEYLVGVIDQDDFKEDS